MVRPPLRYELLYDLVATGMWVFSRTFRVRVLGPPLWLEPGHLVVSTHRAETDVPLICPIVFFRGGMWRRHTFRINFAAREDLFERGVLAALTPSAPLALRRVLHRFDPTPHLWQIRMNPIRSRLWMRYRQALAELPPQTSLDGLLPAELRARLATRAAEHGLAAPQTAGEACRVEFSDLLWDIARRDELGHPSFEEVWERRANAALADVRRLVEVLRAREPMLLFPEGRPSPDGEIGPLMRGIRLLVRHGRVDRLVPLALAYDPLTRGRTRVYLHFGRELAPPREGLEEFVLDALRRAMPLTCGQVAAHELVERASAGETTFGAGALDASLLAALARCREEGRAAEPALLRAEGRRARVSECLDALARRGLVERTAGSVVLAPDLVAADPVVLRLAREYESARELGHSSPDSAEAERSPDAPGSARAR